MRHAARHLQALTFIVVVALITARGSGTTESAQPAESAPGVATAQATRPAPSIGLTVHGDPPDPTDVSDELKRIYQHVDTNFGKHVERLRQWGRIPSISNTVEGTPGVWESAKFLKELIVNDLGCMAEIYSPGVSEWDAPAHPVVYGRCDVGAEKTILDYIQADVMPVWPEEDWPAPPFGGVMMEKPPFKRVIYGRGINNQKGKEMAQLAALISIKEVTSTLPVNAIFLADHDEERMELGPRTFMFNNPEKFKGVSVAFGYAGSQQADGRGEIVGMSIGCVVVELSTSMPRHGLWLAQQPMFRHFKMMTMLFDEERSAVFRDIAQDVLPPSSEEMEYLRRESQQIGMSMEEVMRRRTGIRVTVTGTWGGNIAPGYAGNIRPPRVTSKVDIRFPPSVEGEDVVRKVRAHLNRSGYQDVEMKVIGIVPWSWANADNEMGEAIRRMYRQFRVPFNEPPKGNYMGVWTAYGPPSLFTREPLQVPHLRGGLGLGVGAHYTPEGEYYVIQGDGQKIYGFAGAIKSQATVLYNYAGKNPSAAPRAGRGPGAGTGRELPRAWRR